MKRQKKKKNFKSFPAVACKMEHAAPKGLFKEFY
jgi:hypothetical protein